MEYIHFDHIQIEWNGWRHAKRDEWSPMWSALNLLKLPFFLFVCLFSFSTSPLPPPWLVLVVLLLLLCGVGVPGEPLLVEGDHHLRALDVRLLGWDQVGLVRIFPGVKKRNYRWDYSGYRVRCTNNRDDSTTHHFMRNMSSPVESVAPMILSGSKLRAKPLSFSV